MSKPLHRKASAFRFVFADVKSFRELETRITRLPDEKARGDAFEVFAEAYLATQRKHDAANVWPHGSMPLDILKNLGLTQQDQGVDGVLQTLLGEFYAYQVKFRTRRTSLIWRELSTFIGLADSPHIKCRVLLTNCDELPTVLNERQGFFCIRGSDLDRLEAADFSAIEAWLADATYTAPKKTPNKHQAEAMDALLPALQTHDRVSALMACGTGKTLVALWVTERSEAKRILILLPSLALLRQTLHEWLRETHLPSLAYLCVCSDPTVIKGIDALVTQQTDLDFQVSTDAASVRSFMDAPFAGVKMVFSTYQSASVVGKSMKPGETFDFAVFDEAHKTAGREGRNFTYALDDKNLSIRKRLFLTATPRHYNPHARDPEGEAKLLFSMDNPEVYGPQAYRLTFTEAARRGIICNYKVIISVITSGMVTNELLNSGEVFVNGDAVRARQVANQIALRDAIEKYGVNKIFTFHKTVDSAASFVADASEGIRTHLPGFKTFHVNGSMPTARREQEMRDFRASARAIVSNARCLTEGVDVPAVDMVAFLSPRRSRVDIVQATGRAMRRSPGKTTGYVLVPLYVELTTGETVEAAVNRAEFDEVWDVLNSLQEQDDVFSELIRSVGEQRGRGKGFDDSRFNDRIDFGGPRLHLEALRDAVATHCLENLYTSWDMWFGKLKAFKERFGNCNVETGWEEDPTLAAWVSAQRTKQNNGLLYPERIRLLDELGFVWDFQTQKAQENWMKWYRELENYTREHGNPHVPRTYTNTKLANWVWTQRQRRQYAIERQGTLTPEQIELLNKLGFRWDANEEKWTMRLEELKRFIGQHGHCEICIEAGADGELVSWVKAQRLFKSKGKLDAEREAKLDAIGFNWNSKADDLKWQKMYERLKQYHAINGNSNVPAKWKEDQKLAAWLHRQLQRRKNGQLPDEDIRLLDNLNVTWKSRDVGTWEDRLAEVAAFKAKHGHCNIPLTYPENPKLGRFVNQMRTQRNNRSLSDDRTQKLNDLGFMWESSRTTEVGGEGINAAWKARYDDLVHFKEKTGNCKVPNEWPDNPRLGHWVAFQRKQRKSGKLHPNREELLNCIGFDWRGDENKEEWQTRFNELMDYKKRFGDCFVPVKWIENPQLGGWVSRQRRFKKSGKLLPERERMLNELGFTFAYVSEAKNSVHKKIPKITTGAITTLWKRMFDELVRYQTAYGNCDVPVKWEENIQLGMWVAAQRSLRKSGKLRPDREQMLNEIGFEWHTDRNKMDWNRRFEQLEDYKRRFGNCLVPVNWVENPQLGRWVAQQRHFSKGNKLSAEKKQLLIDLCFTFSHQGTTARQVNRAWNDWFDELTQYKVKFGDCNVPTKGDENRKLGVWVSNQRQLKKQRKLKSEREQMLNKIGFVW